MTVSATKTTMIVCTTVGAIWLAAAQPAAATPLFATQTGESCGQCHVSPKGAGPLTPAGQAFKANGNKAPKEKEADATSPGTSPPKK
jgi:hypothetical protein